MHQTAEHLTETLHVRITPSCRAQLDQRSAERGVRLSTLARAALAAGLERLETREKGDNDDE